MRKLAILASCILVTVSQEFSTLSPRDPSLLEGSGSEPPSMVTVGLEPRPQNEVAAADRPEFLSQFDAGVSVLPTFPKRIDKRAAEFYNGVVESRFFFPFNMRSTVPPEAVFALGRPLQRGAQPQSLEYIALWVQRGEPPHWGSVRYENGAVEATFIDDVHIVNISSQGVPAGSNIRILQYVGSPEQNNFKFNWRVARDVDPSTVISMRRDGKLCSARVAPAVYKDGSYEFLGEADIDNRQMRYIFHGTINLVEKSDFTNKVFLLTKDRCRCSC